MGAVSGQKYQWGESFKHFQHLQMNQRKALASLWASLRNDFDTPNSSLALNSWHAVPMSNNKHSLNLYELYNRLHHYTLLNSLSIWCQQFCSFLPP